MTNRQQDEDDDYNDEIFGALIAEENIKNQRTAVRYIRTDISSTLSIPGLFILSKKIPVKLLDISSKGAAIECEKKISVKKKVILDLVFKDNQCFTISAQIIHQTNNKKQYGLRFDSFNNKLGDYLLSSQNDLIFK